MTPALSLVEPGPLPYLLSVPVPVVAGHRPCYVFHEIRYHMIRLVKQVERDRPQQHPVGMTFQHRGGENETLFEGPADWISPDREGGYREDPPAGRGRKVILSDTDHLWGIGGNEAWGWQSFLRGLNPISMDPYDGEVLGAPFDPESDPIRRAMGQALRYAGRLDPATMTPQGELASSGYRLAAPGRAYRVYLPEGGEVTVDLGDAEVVFSVEWFHPDADEAEAGDPIRGGGPRTFRSPFDEADAVLLLEADR